MNPSRKFTAAILDAYPESNLSFRPCKDAKVGSNIRYQRYQDLIIYDAYRSGQEHGHEELRLEALAEIWLILRDSDVFPRLQTLELYCDLSTSKFTRDAEEIVEYKQILNMVVKYSSEVGNHIVNYAGDVSSHRDGGEDLSHREMAEALLAGMRSELDKDELVNEFTYVLELGKEYKEGRDRLQPSTLYVKLCGEPLFNMTDVYSYDDYSDRRGLGCRFNEFRCLYVPAILKHRGGWIRSWQDRGRRFVSVDPEIPAPIEGIEYPEFQFNNGEFGPLLEKVYV